MLAVLSVGGALAQQQTGDLYGAVGDEHQAPLPGAAVTLTGMGAPQVQQTDQAGRFRFVGLYPGLYALECELEGFGSVEYPSIGVRLGGKSEIEITLDAATKETITVTDEGPLLDERQTSRGVNLEAADLDKVPTARDPWSLLSQAPGVQVDRLNLGGNESGQESQFNGPGASARDNQFSVDGVIVSDMSSIGGSATYFDFGAFEEVQLTVSSTDVDVMVPGVTINQVTKRAANAWRGAARILRTDGALQSGPPKIDGVEGNKIDRVDELGGDLGGRIVADHLWVWAALGRSHIANIVQGGQLDATTLKDFNSKLNFALGANSGGLHYWTNDRLKSGRGAGPTRAPETTWEQTAPVSFYEAEDSQLVGGNLYLHGLYAHSPGRFNLSPRGGLDADVFLDDAGVLRGSFVDIAQKARIDQWRLDGSRYFQLGHGDDELKFGAGFRSQENNSASVWPRGKLVLSGAFLGFDDPDLALVGFARTRKAGVDTTYASAWLQDTLSFERLTVNAGLRYDGQKGKLLPESDAGNPQAQGLLPAIRFPGNDGGGFEWRTIVPRVSAAYALGEDRQTLLRGTFSRYAEQLGHAPLFTLVNPLGYGYAYFYFTDANHNLVLDPPETESLAFAFTANIDPANPGALSSPNVNDKNLEPTLTDELTFSLERGLSAHLVASAALTFRRIHGIPEQRPFVVDAVTGATRLVRRDDYVLDHYDVAKLPNGKDSSPVPVYDLRQGLAPTFGSLFTNGDRTRSYEGLTLGLTKRLASRWMARGYASYSRHTWHMGNEYKSFADPTDVVADGLGYADRSGDVFAEQSYGNKSEVLVGGHWSFNLYGLYQVAADRPWGFEAALSVNGRQGYVSPPYVADASAFGRRLVQLASDLEDFRNPDVIDLDGHLGKDFAFHDFALTLAIDGFNLMNRSYVLQRERNAHSSRAYHVNETLSPRVFRVGLTLRWR